MIAIEYDGVAHAEDSAQWNPNRIAGETTLDDEEYLDPTSLTASANRRTRTRESDLQRRGVSIVHAWVA